MTPRCPALSVDGSQEPVRGRLVTRLGGKDRERLSRLDEKRDPAWHGVAATPASRLAAHVRRHDLDCSGAGHEGRSHGTSDAESGGSVSTRAGAAPEPI